MHRLFIAFRPPEPVRARLMSLMKGVGGARWQNEEQLHLTLRFIGEVDRHRAADIDAALQSVHHLRFEVTLDGLHSFERRGEPTTLWAGVAPREPLKTLHKKVDQALVRAGLEPERRAYTPHVTLARLPRGASAIAGFVDHAGPLAGHAFAIEDFCLYESRLTPAGAVYTIIERYRLG